jgi:hypothetical protein
LLVVFCNMKTVGWTPKLTGKSTFDSWPPSTGKRKVHEMLGGEGMWQWEQWHVLRWRPGRKVVTFMVGFTASLFSLIVNLTAANSRTWARSSPQSFVAQRF